MKRIVLALAALCAIVAVSAAQPVPVTWRPPATCSTGNFLKWSGSAWTCSGGTGVTSSTGTVDTIPKYTAAAAIGNSLLTDNATTLSYNGGKFTVTAANGNFHSLGTAQVDGNSTLGAANTNVTTINGYTNVVGTSAAKFVYLGDLGTNYGVIYDSGGKVRIGGASTVGGAAAIESLEIDPNSAAVTALGTLTSQTSTTLNNSSGTTTIKGAITAGANSGDATANSFQGSTVFKTTGVDTNALVKLQNDVQTWQFGVRGASASDQLIIRDETGGIDAIGISKVSGSITYVGIGNSAATNAIAPLDIYNSNAGQTTAALTDAGSRSGLAFHQDGGTAGNTGGGICFGNNSSHAANVLGWACLKGLVTSGAGNTTGDLAIATRNATGDTALTERLRILGGGNVGISTTAPKGLLSVASTNTGDPNGSLSAWDLKYSIFGPNVGSSTGAALGLGYDTTNDVATIVAAVPNTGFKPVRISSAGVTFNSAGGALGQKFDQNGGIWFGDSANSSIVNNVDVVTVGQTGTAQTASKSNVLVTNSGTYDTTAGAISPVGVNSTMSASRSAGANSLLNIAFYATSSGAQTNYAYYSNAGDNYFNVSGGTAGFGTAPNPTYQLAVDAATGKWGVHATSTPTAEASNDLVGVEGTAQGTYNTTSAQRLAYGTRGVSTATRSSGSNALIDVGLYGHAAGGQANWGLWIDAGDSHMDSNAFINGNLTSGDGAGDVFDHNGQLSKFGNTADGEAYFFEDELDFHYADNSTQTGYINYSGYNHTNAQFRNLIIADGKNNSIALYTGSDKSATFYGQIIDQRAVSSTFSSGAVGNLIAIDTTSMVQGDGGKIEFQGAWTGSSVASAATIKAEKSNGTDSNYDFDLSFGLRRTGDPYGVVYNKRLIIDATGATNMLGEGVGVGGVHASYLGADYTDIFYSGLLRKNLSLYSAVVGDNVATDGHWRAVNSGSTLAYTTTSQTTPRGYSNTVGQITCTNGGTLCSAGISGSKLHYVATSATTFITDLRQKTMTISAWVKSSSGTNAGFIIGLARYNENDGGTTTCTVNATTWTRCTYTRTFDNTSYTDNTELRGYLAPGNTTAHYVADVQIELGKDPTPIEDTGTAIGGHAAAYNAFPLSAYSAGAGGDTGYGIWTYAAGIGGSNPNQPSIYLGPQGDIGGRSLSVGQSGTGIPGGTVFYGVDTELTNAFGTGSTAYTVYGVKAVASTSRSSGTGAITQYAVYADSQSGQTNWAIYADHGDVKVGATSGTFTSHGAATFDSTATVTSTLTASSSTNKGTITLVAGSGTATVASGAVCTCTDRTSAAAVKCVVATTTLTATGTGTDSIAYLCL